MTRKARWILVLACLVILLLVRLQWMPEFKLSWRSLIGQVGHYDSSSTISHSLQSSGGSKQAENVSLNRVVTTNWNRSDQGQGKPEMAAGRRFEEKSTAGHRGYTYSTGSKHCAGPVQSGGGGTLSSLTTQPEVHHICFLKVYKAGSTTIQNMLFRFALRRNLTVRLPKNSHIFSSFKHIHQDFLPLPNGSHYDIFASHSVFHPQVYFKYIHRDSKFIGIVREPLQQMISAAFYYRHVADFKRLIRISYESLITSLIRYPERYDNTTFSMTKNSMAKDFGFTRDITTTEKITNYLQYLNQSFSFVLVMEQFEESLVLLKRLFHWQLSDIIYLVANRNRHQPVSLDEDDIRLFSKRNFLDIAIYNFFKEELQRKITLAGTDFQQEVTHTKSVLKDISEFCLKSKGILLDIQGSPWNDFFTVTGKDCKQMKTEELRFFDLLRSRHKNLMEDGHQKD